MSVRGTLGGALTAAVVLVVGWQAAAAGAFDAKSASGSASSSGSGSGSGSTGSGSGASTSSGSASSGTGSSSTGSSSAYKDGTYTGAVETNRWGEVQVQITVSGGRITAATALKSPDRDGRSQMINQQAVPLLNAEVTAAQSADIQTVSGATYTSDSYAQSLQSAIDQAKS